MMIKASKMPTLITTTAFPYSIPPTNPYTQRRGQTSSQSLSSSQQSAQKQFERNLRVLSRSNNVPTTQNLEQLGDLLDKCDNERSTSLWSLSMAEGFATYIIRIFGHHENVGVNTTGRNRNPDGYPATLSFLARCLEQWSHDVSIMYPASTKEMEVQSDHSQQTNHMSLLQTIHHLVAHLKDDPIIQNPALVCLSIIWRHLDRIHRLTCWESLDSSFPSHTIDSAWWMPSQDEQALANVALNGLLMSDNKAGGDANTYVYLREEELKTAWMSLLTQMLKHGKTSWLHQLASQNMALVNKFSQDLLEGMRRLSSHDLTSLHILHNGIACAALLCLMNHRETLEVSNQFNQLFYSSKLLDSVFQSLFAVFGASTPSGPRWIFEHKDASTGLWMEEFVVVWSQCKDAETRYLAFDALERHWKSHIEQGWHSFLTEDFSSSSSSSSTDDFTRKHKHCAELVSRMVLLYSVHHSSLRSTLFTSMERVSKSDGTSVNYLVEPCKKLLKTFQSLSLHPDTTISLFAASLTKKIFSERGSLLPNHDIYEKAIDRDIIRACLMSIVNLVKPQGICHSPITRPQLLCLLDILDLVLSWDHFLWEAINLVDSEVIEIFISLMSPKEIRIDQAGAFLDTSSQNTTMMEESDSDTPPVNNLSRLDERSICVEREEIETASTCLDHYIRIAAATVLSRIGYFNIDSHFLQQAKQVGGVPINQEGELGLQLLQNRIRQSVPEFFSTSSVQQSEEDDQPTDSPVSSFGSFSSASLENTRRRLRLMLAMAVPENEAFLAGSLLAEGNDNIVKQLREQIEACQQQLQEAVQTQARLSKEKDDYRRKMEAQSVRFWKDAEKMKKAGAEETRSKISQYDAKRKHAEKIVERLQVERLEIEARAQEADQAAISSRNGEAQVRLELQHASAEVNALGEENRELKRQLEGRDLANKEQVANLEGEQRRLQNTLEHKDETIAQLKEARDTMEANLDNLFSDLVKLCQMYETVEIQGKHQAEENDKISRQLQEERKEKDSAEMLLRNDNEQLKAENEILEKKLNRYREKMQSMKQERDGSSSHNHHKSLRDSNSNRASGRSTNRPDESSAPYKNSSHDRRGKENSYAYESQRRSRPRDEKQDTSRRKERTTVVRVDEKDTQRRSKVRADEKDTQRRAEKSYAGESQRRSKPREEYSSSAHFKARSYR